MEQAHVFDFEVTAYDWILVILDPEDNYHIFHNDGDAVEVYLEERPLLAGFNTKHYDNHILRAVCAGWSPQQIKWLNDEIIGGKEGWEIPQLKQCPQIFDSFDLMDDVQLGTSLKSYEAHSGMTIVESSVDFDIDHPLTDEELAEMVHYCKYDVWATKQLLQTRKNYLQTKIDLGTSCGLSERESLTYTNAKLTAKYLKAVRPSKPYTDERQYVFPENLKYEYVPQEVIDFFRRMYDDQISDDELFHSELDIDVGGCPTRLAFGGIHGAIPNYREDGEV